VQADYLIIGQGICGTLLSRHLKQAGKSFVIIDNPGAAVSSKVASGLINPVTGKRHVKTWLYDELLPVALETYEALEKELNIPLIRHCDIIQFHTSPEERDVFEEKAAIMPEHLNTAQDNSLHERFQYYFRTGAVAPCLLIDGNGLLNSWRGVLKNDNQLLEEVFDINDCTIGEHQVRYKDITASGIIFCEGSIASDNPYFSLLPFSNNKGEVIIARIPDLPRDHIYKQQLKIVPWKDDLFWIGSSFVWKYDNVLPTSEYRARVAHVLRNWLKLPLSIEDHMASERPSSVDYKPFVGFHPFYPLVGILNGTGTKGYSLAPYFARQLADLLVSGKEVMADVSVDRFRRVLGRK
jgi:glycine/D-amino acid oxidase-like deaminating enzyme